MIFYRILIVGILIYFPFLMVYHGYFNSTVSPKEGVLWFQNFQNKSKFNLDLNVTNYPNFQRQFFHSPQFLAYFNNQGEIIHKIFTDSQSTLYPQNQGYLFMKKMNPEITYFDQTGMEKWSYSTLTYPILSPLRNNVLLLATDNTTISMIDRNQQQLIPPQYVGTMITDISFCPYNDQVAIGTIDSNLFFYNALGEELFQQEIKSSEYNYIKSVQCSFSGDHIAVLHGLRPEKITLFNKKGELLWSQATQVERRKKTSLEIDEINQLIYDQRGQQLFFLALATGEVVQTIDLEPTSINYSLFSSADNYVLVGLSGDFQQTVNLYNTDGEMIWQKKFNESRLQYLEIKQTDRVVNVLIILRATIYAYQISSIL